MRPVVLFIAIAAAGTAACTKDPDVQMNGVPTFADSVTMVQGDWKLAKDSSTNIGNYYFTENGQTLFPTPGVYMGKSEDYWKFNSNAIVSIRENQNTYSSAYALYANNRLVIKDMLVHDTAHVIALTANNFTFQWSVIGVNGGQYFRRVYLTK